MNIAFKKYQGTGNDFILIDDRLKTFPASAVKLIERLCDRRFGIGADGLILLQNHPDGDFYMQYYNNDGRQSSMCGNGGRCIAQFAFDLGLVNGSANFYAIDGAHKAESTKAKNGDKLVNLQMIDVGYVEKLKEDVFVLNTGSPHYVHFLANPIDELDLVADARKIRYSEPYKDAGINVNYVNLLNLREIKIRTYERGVEDETYSCGTGATASALAVAVFNNLPGGRHQVQVHVKGGELLVQFNFDKKGDTFSDIWLCGPAKMVFEGNVDIIEES